MTNKYIISGVNYGRDLNATVKGTKDFQYWEFVSSDTAIRNGIKNIPTEANWLAIELLCQVILQPCRDKFGELKISSGYRNEALSLLVKSSTASNHFKGEACDFEAVSPDVTNMMLLEYIHNTFDYHELIAEFFGEDPHAGWVHVAYRAGSKAKNLKLKDNTHHFTKVTVAELKKIYS